ncbi:hypothetical protein HYX05_00125 [Candidatus Woesearchaeota archaeon]|nr:hypothetical protein [Candidatus Woesearchaeota archaeon]
MASIIPVFGLAGALVSPVTIDDKPRSCADFGIPNFERMTPFLVKDDNQNIKSGKSPVTTKKYKIGDLEITTTGTPSAAEWLLIQRSSGQKEKYLYLGNNSCERAY